MNLATFKKYYRERYGSEGTKNLNERLTEIEEKCISYQGISLTLQDLIRQNKAGESGKSLSLKAFIEKFCREEFLDDSTFFEN